MLYMCIESWLHDRTTNETRGKFLSIYMITIYFALGASQFLLNLWEPSAFALFGICSVLMSIALVPVALARTPAPPLPSPDYFGLRRLYRISPLGTGRMFCKWCRSRCLLWPWSRICRRCCTRYRRHRPLHGRHDPGRSRPAVAAWLVVGPVRPAHGDCRLLRRHGAHRWHRDRRHGRRRGSLAHGRCYQRRFRLRSLSALCLPCQRLHRRPGSGRSERRADVGLRRRRRGRPTRGLRGHHGNGPRRAVRPRWRGRRLHTCSSAYGG